MDAWFGGLGATHGRDYGAQTRHHHGDGTDRVSAVGGAQKFRCGQAKAPAGTPHAAGRSASKLRLDFHHNCCYCHPKGGYMALVIAGRIVPMSASEPSAVFPGRIYLGDDGFVDAVVAGNGTPPPGFAN